MYIIDTMIHNLYENLHWNVWPFTLQPMLHRLQHHLYSSTPLLCWFRVAVLLHLVHCMLFLSNLLREHHCRHCDLVSISGIDQFSFCISLVSKIWLFSAKFYIPRYFSKKTPCQWLNEVPDTDTGQFLKWHITGAKRWLVTPGKMFINHFFNTAFRQRR